MAAYKVLSFDETTGSIVVLFDGVDVPISVDVPFDDSGKYITGPELDEWVSGFYPHGYMSRTARIAAGVSNVDAIRKMVQAPATPVQTVEDQQIEQNMEMWSQFETEKMIAKVLVKFGVLETDPTAIGVTSL